jgi:hypothetical protein
MLQLDLNRALQLVATSAKPMSTDDEVALGVIVASIGADGKVFTVAGNGASGARASSVGRTGLPNRTRSRLP